MSDVSSALALAAAGVPATLCRPCEDCGLITGRFCDSCFAIDRVPSEVWAASQLTPLSSSCRNRYGKCHYCRGMTWVTAPPWTEVKEAAMRAPHGSASSSYGIPTQADNVDTPQGFVNGALCELGTSSSPSNAYGARTEFQSPGALHDHVAMW